MKTMKLTKRSEVNPESSKIRGLFNKSHSAYNENEPGEKPHKRTKKFDGKVYRLYHVEIMNKSVTDEIADYLKSRNYLVRVVKEPNHNEWLIYYRKK